MVVKQISISHITTLPLVFTGWWDKCLQIFLRGNLEMRHMRNITSMQVLSLSLAYSRLKENKKTV